MHPEELDRLRRTGEINGNPLHCPEDLKTVADQCREEYALKLFSSTVTMRQYLTGQKKPTCFPEGMACNHVRYADAIIKIFVEQRLTLQDGAVLCRRVVPKNEQEVSNRNGFSSLHLPDPVSDDFTVVQWEPYSGHYHQFPHMVLLVREDEPRVYTVLPMPAELSELEDTAFELAKIFSVYSQSDLCLVLSPDKCVYIRKDTTYKRSNQRPTGGALAHRSITGPYLYRLHLEPLQAFLKARPDAFEWHDAFETNPELYSGREYNQVEAVVELSDEIDSRVKDQIGQVLAEFRPSLQMMWDGDVERLQESTAAWVSALGLSNSVRVIHGEDLARVAANPIPGSEFLTSALYRKLSGALDVMDHDLKRAGLYDALNSLLSPVYTASHYGYMNLLVQSATLAGPADSDIFWKRIQGQVYPAAVCSPITLLRLEIWRRIEKLYRASVPPVDTTVGTYAEAQSVLSSLSLLSKVNAHGPMWLWQSSEGICVTPTVVVRFDEEGDPHCDDGPAIITPDGTKQFWIHGEQNWDHDQEK